MITFLTSSVQDTIERHDIEELTCFMDTYQEYVNVLKDQYSNQSLLQLATRNRWYEGVLVLLRNGVDVNYYTDDGMTALAIACSMGEMEIIKLFVLGNKWFVVDEVDADNRTLLAMACEHGHLHVVKALLDLHANTSIYNLTTRYRPVHVACRHGHIDILKTLMVHGANVHYVEGEPNPLQVACEYDRLEIIHLLLDVGVENIDSLGPDGRTPLHTSIVMGNIVIVNELIRHGSDIHKRSLSQRTGLHFAAEYGRTEIVKMFLQHGAYIDVEVPKSDISVRDMETPLFMAMNNDHFDVIETLLVHGATLPSLTDRNKTMRAFVLKVHNAILRNGINGVCREYLETDIVRIIDQYCYGYD